MHVKLNGHSHSGNQRFLCKVCGYSFTFHNLKNKRHREKRTFVLWITEGYSVRQLVDIGPHGIWKVNQIRKSWLELLPPRDSGNLSAVRYIQFDGTYFKRQNCLMVVMDNATARGIGHRYHYRENYASSHDLFTQLKARGLEPSAITIDGNINVIRALKAVWPGITLQRCMAHIQRQGLAWLRRYPKLEASKQLRSILLGIADIRDEQGKQAFINDFNDWEKRYSSFVKALPSKDKVYGDLQRARSLIVHALPDMFHYLDDSNIAATTNKLEGYFSRLKELYRRHRGMSKQHRQNYFAWYIHLKNGD